jgi:hypothetical protein
MAMGGRARDPQGTILHRRSDVSLEDLRRPETMERPIRIRLGSPVHSSCEILPSTGTRSKLHFLAPS